MRITRSRRAFAQLLRGLDVCSLLALDVGTRRIVDSFSLSALPMTCDPT